MPKEFSRTRRVAGLIQRELGPLIQQYGRELGGALISVTAVDVSPDLKQSKIYISCLGGSRATSEILKALGARRGSFRHALAKTLRLRVVPRLNFELDEGVVQGRRISALLDGLDDLKIDDHSGKRESGQH